jgi:hypothetical protein
LSGETPVVLTADGIEHFYDRRDHCTYHIVRQEGDFNVVKVEEVVADEDEDGSDKLPVLPTFPYRRRRAQTGRWEIADSNAGATIVYDILSGSEADDGQHLNRKAKKGKDKAPASRAKNAGKQKQGGNKVGEALRAAATKAESQSEYPSLHPIS